MERIGFVMRLLPGAEAEYRRRHAAVWPEMLDELRAAGARELLDLPPRRRPVRLPRGRGLRRVPGAHGGQRGQRPLAGRDGRRLIDPLTDPATGFHQPARRGLPPRLMPSPGPPRYRGPVTVISDAPASRPIPSSLVDIDALWSPPITTSSRTLPTLPSASPSGRRAIADRRSAAPSTRPTSSRRPRRSSATAARRGPRGRCSSAATPMPSRIRRPGPRSRSSRRTASTSGSTPTTATRRRRRSRTRSSAPTATRRRVVAWPTASSSRRPTTRPTTAASSTTRPTAARPTPTSPAGSRTEANRILVRPGRRGHRRRRPGPLRLGPGERDRVRLPGALRRRPRLGHRHGRDRRLGAPDRRRPDGRRLGRLLGRDPATATGWI